MSDNETSQRRKFLDKKEYRFEQNINRDSNKSRFTPALKAEKQKILEPLNSELTVNDKNQDDFQSEYIDLDQNLYDFDKIDPNSLQAEMKAYNNKEKGNLEVSTNEQTIDSSKVVETSKRSRPLEDYQIPFLKQNKAAKEFSDYYVYLENETEQVQEVSSVKQEETIDSDIDHHESIHPPSSRSTYTPSFKLTNRYERVDSKQNHPLNQDLEVEVEHAKNQYEIVDAKASTFVPKKIPTPYKEKITKYHQVDNQLRVLAKRLVKTKDSFLRFEN
ncbi:hypothetical protein ACTQ54_06190 [Fundicoccus sp. Sow4_H7]|uniref:hypothetical protein n=1 Tax=Fundicoccus sp. Sow4_H7 TaxID=3438784 RepID=UPI003F9309D4